MPGSATGRCTTDTDVKTKDVIDPVLGLDNRDYVYWGPAFRTIGWKLQRSKPDSTKQVSAETGALHLAQAIGVDRHHLSRAVNSKTTGNLYAFINRFCIDDFSARIERGETPREYAVRVEQNRRLRKNAARRTALVAREPDRVSSRM